ncbi:MAG: PIN domain-containing protein [Flavobacteriales bacterium]|nr:PIN domain-containing protein [Flavobacteriales bacterium]
MRALIDSDVLVAMLDGTEDQSPESTAVIQAAVRGKFTGFITPLIAANVMYILRRKWRTTRPDTWRADIDRVTLDMLATLGMIPVGRPDFIDSITSSFTDKEDGVQYFAALRSRQVDVIVTCNTKDFVMKGLEAIEPERFIRQYLK